MSEQVLTKKDAAQRQLVTAIRLLLDNGDLVSIYSLVANAWEIIDTLATKAGIESISGQTRENVPAGKDLKYDYINAPYRNFFKHADCDPDAVVPQIRDKDVLSLTFLAVEDYVRLFKKAPLEVQVFQLWYIALNTAKVAPGAMNNVENSLKSRFPNIERLSRDEQLRMAREALADARLDKDLLTDPRTETAC